MAMVSFLFWNQNIFWNGFYVKFDVDTSDIVSLC